jgi:AcrR family transcriptional regulator
MQEKKERRSNADRTQTMRDGLIASARELFVEKGYAETSTPEIVARAKVTRGALYHHFEDKASLFRAVITAESELVAEAINVATQDCSNAAEALNAGTDAYLDAMTVPGRTRLLLIDGPSALGREAMDAIDRETSGGTMVLGLTAALGRPADSAIRAHASLLSAAFDRAALDINAGGDAPLYRAVLKRMLAEAVEANRA